jgi:geranylgeranyl transferase type-2 subunit beta
LVAHILFTKDGEAGGIADRPGDMVDVFHTVFGVAGEPHTKCRWRLYNKVIPFTGLSLLGYPDLEDVDPVYCMPAPVIEKLGLRKGWVALPRRPS